MSRNKTRTEERHENGGLVINNSKSWIFHQFPVRYTSPRMQRARRAKEQRTSNMEAFQYPVTKIPVKFNPDATKTNMNLVKRGIPTSRGALNDEMKPFITSCFIEKYELKQRFNNIEIERKICKHCNYENVFYRKKSIEGFKRKGKAVLSPNEDARKLDIVERDKSEVSINKLRNNDGTSSNDGGIIITEALARHRDILLQQKIHTVKETDSFEPRQSTKNKQKIIIQMPEIAKLVTTNVNKNVDHEIQKPTFSYTHRQK